jgi:hypothetical protein
MSFDLDDSFVRSAINDILEETSNDEDGIRNLHSKICSVYASLRMNPLFPEEMGSAGLLISDITKKFVEIVFGNGVGDQNMDIYSACRKDKLSFHFVHR